jgi:nicotinamidase-related amidase
MQLDARTTALILIDLQRGVMAMPLAPHSAGTVYERSMRLADRFRAASGLVVRIRVSFSRDLADAPRSLVDQPMKHGALPPGWDEFPEPLDPSDVVITKRHWLRGSKNLVAFT